MWLKKFLKSFLSLPFILRFHIIFGHYYSICSSKTQNNLVHLYCILSSIAAIFLAFKNPGISYVLSSSLAFIAITIFCLFKKNDYVLKYFTDIKLIDHEMGITKTKRSQRKYQIFHALHLTRMIVPTIVFWESSFPYMALIFMEFSNNLTVLTRLEMFEVFYDRMKLLQASFRRCLASTNSSEPVQVTRTILSVRKQVRIYYMLLDSLLEDNTSLQLTILSFIAANFLQTMLNVYNYFKLAMPGTFEIGPEWIEILVATVFILAPAVFMGLAMNEVEKIKQQLSTTIAHCKDEYVSEELRHALNAVSWRPAQFRLCRCVPVDATLPLSYIGLCITYIVAILQLGNFNNTSA